MAEKAMAVYLNDHLAGAMLGSELAEQIRSRSHGTSLGSLMDSVAPQIEEDRQTLTTLMQRMSIARNPGKQAVTWVAEKLSRAKFWGPVSGEPGLGTYLAVESLTLGVVGKLSLWRALADVADSHPALATVDLDELIDRAQTQCELLERERRSIGRHVLGDVPASVAQPGVRA